MQNVRISRIHDYNALQTLYTNKLNPAAASLRRPNILSSWPLVLDRCQVSDVWIYRVTWIGFKAIFSLSIPNRSALPSLSRRILVLATFVSRTDASVECWSNRAARSGFCIDVAMDEKWLSWLRPLAKMAYPPTKMVIRHAESEHLTRI